MESQPKAIFFDAVGTLFGIRSSVGQIYSEIANRFGVEVSADELDRAFRQAFQAAPPPAFPDATPEALPELEKQWWRAIVQSTFINAGAIDRFADFPTFYKRLYNHFATAAPWQVYPDVLPTLDKYRDKGIELGVISNFDSRLHAVLDALELRSYFRSITISTTAGAAKPDAKIFHAALAKHNLTPDLAWHIGDSPTDDYEGAKAVGMKAILIKR